MAINFGAGDIKKALDAIMKSEVAAVFHREGFLSKGTTFYKAEADFVKFIDVGRSRWNTGVSYGFWFNVQIFGGGFPEKKSISLPWLLREGHPLFCRRLGYLWDRENHEYTITPSTDMRELAGRIRYDIAAHLFPFYARLRSLEEVLAFLLNENKRLGRNEYSYLIALMLAKTGKKEESKKFFRESLGVQEAIAKTARALGIDL